MKKILSFMLVICMLSALDGCGNSTAGQRLPVTASGNQQSSAETNAQETGSNSVAQQTTAESSDNQQSSAETDAAETEENNAEQAAQEIDVDLTQLSSTMVYSEVYNMMYTPGYYTGLTVKMNGTFAVYCQKMDENGQPDLNYPIYYACVIADATACCSQGLEFVLSGGHSYPDDYPEPGADITVTGTFEIYEEDGFRYCHLVNAVIE